MSIKRLLLLSSLLLVGGFLFLMLQRNWLIVHVAYFPFSPTSTADNMKSAPAYQKQITISYYKNGGLVREESIAMWHENDIAQTLKQVVKQWLNVLQDAHLLRPHLAVATVAVATGSGEAYVSFDSALFIKEMSIKSKWLIIESLCKTIRDNELALHALTLLNNDHPMDDDHLDFSHPLSLESRL